jgi:hypothetical protein
VHSYPLQSWRRAEHNCISLAENNGISSPLCSTHLDSTWPTVASLAMQLSLRKSTSPGVLALSADQLTHGIALVGPAGAVSSSRPTSIFVSPWPVTYHIPSWTCTQFLTQHARFQCAATSFIPSSLQPCSSTVLRRRAKFPCWRGKHNEIPCHLKSSLGIRPLRLTYVVYAGLWRAGPHARGN